MRTRIKICGITSPEIAQYAVDAGADAIGLMFYPESSRYLSIDQAIEINRKVSPFVAQVGVFVNPERPVIERILSAVHLDYLQFHGEESPEYCASFGKSYIKAIRVSETTDLLAMEAEYRDSMGLLLDSHVADYYGGSGKSFAWSQAKYGGKKPIVLAGGLTADNVEVAIAAAAPYAVDVSSGVETEGVKERAKMIKFCRQVNRGGNNDL